MNNKLPIPFEEFKKRIKDRIEESIVDLHKTNVSDVICGDTENAITDGIMDLFGETLEQMTVENVNAIIKDNKLETNQISDGYHTFKELYNHRIANFMALCREVSHNLESHNSVWKSKKHSDGKLAFGGTWFVLGINSEPGKQITYHLPISKWEECYFAIRLDKAPEYDGHTSEQALERLKTL